MDGNRKGVGEPPGVRVRLPGGWGWTLEWVRVKEQKQKAGTVATHERTFISVC